LWGGWGKGKFQCLPPTPCETLPILDGNTFFKEAPPFSLSSSYSLLLGRSYPLKETSKIYPFPPSPLLPL